MRWVVLAIVISISTTSHAQTCEQEAAELREHLTTERRRARRWNVAWGVAFGAAVVGQLAFAIAEVDPLGREFTTDTEETLYVGAAKATLAVGSKVFLPLRIPVPEPAADACADVKSLREALALAAKREKRSFWLTHIGGTTINIAGATILTIRRSFKVGAISFAISYPIGPASAYTQPRRSWKLYRERQPQWTVGASIDLGGASAPLRAPGEPALADRDGVRLWLGGEW